MTNHSTLEVWRSDFLMRQFFSSNAVFMHVTIRRQSSFRLYVIPKPIWLYRAKSSPFPLQLWVLLISQENYMSPLVFNFWTVDTFFHYEYALVNTQVIEFLTIAFGNGCLDSFLTWKKSKVLGGILTYNGERQVIWSQRHKPLRHGRYSPEYLVRYAIMKSPIVNDPMSF